ncbi:MAG: low-affinity phosphate transporter [Phylliscum demangeonii]|nr:MAG: low-affinity phosphate transporter [Phylliscum demangeonii]
MKFSHSIQFNAVPEWSNYYISYSNLKKLIYALEKAGRHAAVPQNTDVEASPLLHSSAVNPDHDFKLALDVELDKICSFYQSKEREIFGEVASIVDDEQIYQADKQAEDPQVDSSGRQRGQSIASWRGRPGSVLRNLGIGRPRPMSAMSGSLDLAGEDSDDGPMDDSITLTRSRILRDLTPALGEALVRSVSDARDSRELPGRKRQVSPGYEDFRDQVFPSVYESSIALKKRAIGVYVSLCELKSFVQLNKTGFYKALKKYDKILNRNLKPVYLEQSVSPAQPFAQETMQALEENILQVEKAYAEVVTRGDVREAQKELRVHLREHVVWERNTVWREMIAIERRAQAANVGMRQTILGPRRRRSRAQLQGDVDESDTREINTPLGKLHVPRWLCSVNFLALIVIAIVFVVFLSVPILKSAEQQNCLAMLVLPPYDRLGTKAAAGYIFSAMWTPVIMLLLGGFSIAAALSKYQIAKKLATFILSKAGTRPSTVLLTNMLVVMIASMWVSNVAAPVLSYSIIQPILRNLPQDSPLSKSLILGIAFAACIGGMASPIASPQNIIALEQMNPEPSWPTKEPFTGVHWFISFVSIGTILLWCVTHQIDNIVGDMGVVALIPMVLFFGTGVLTKEDFNNFLWTIIMLAAGGLALGKAVNSSGLLQTVAAIVVVKVAGMGLYGVFVVFSALILVVASFISHTVAALIILPLVRQIGANMEDPHPNLLVMGSALICSAAMALPTSGFPNMTAIMMEDAQTGQRYLSVKHFISRGIPSSILTFLVIITVGYGLMVVVGL